MPEELTAFTSFAGASVVTALLVQVVKTAWTSLDSKWTPILSVCIGIVVVLLASFGLDTLTRQDIVLGLFTGMFAGFSASGIYSTVSGFVKK